MSGIQKFIKRVCVQTAVYWGTPINDGQGGKTFAAPVEIKCRWKDTTEVTTGKAGKEIISKAKVLVTQTLDEEGYLYLGTILEISVPNLQTPAIIVGAFEIKRFTKVPEFRSMINFVQNAYL